MKKNSSTTRDQLAEKFSLDPKNCMPGFAPIGHVGEAFKAGYDAGCINVLEAVLFGMEVAKLPVAVEIVSGLIAEQQKKGSE